jgi:hypothetical protein
LHKLSNEIAYLASPYFKWPGGFQDAYEEVRRYASKLLEMGVRTFVPICHTHGITVPPGADYADSEFWLDLDSPFFGVCKALIIADMDGWSDSVGVLCEIEWAHKAGMPIFIFVKNSSKFYRMGVGPVGKGPFSFPAKATESGDLFGFSRGLQ